MYEIFVDVSEFFLIKVLILYIEKNFYIIIVKVYMYVKFYNIIKLKF